MSTAGTAKNENATNENAANENARNENARNDSAGNENASDENARNENAASAHGGGGGDSARRGSPSTSRVTAGASGSGFGESIRGAWAIADKDLRVEIRSKEILLTMGYFGFLVVLIFAFTFFRGDAPISTVASGILWVAIAFSGTLGLGRAFDREREGDCIRALLLSPVPRPSIYLGKTLGVLVFMIVVESIVLPAVAFFFNLSLDVDRALRLVAIILLGTIGYAIVGSLLAAMLLRARSKDVLLTIVLYPLILPVLIAGTKATAVLLEEPATEAAARAAQYQELAVWTPMLVFFDVVFLIASLWIFETLVTD